MDQILKLSLLVILAYLLGAIPFGPILAKTFAGIDVRKNGSGNTGATNVRRLAGNKLGLMTLIADVSKGALPVALAFHWTTKGDNLQTIYPIIVLWGAFLGHLYPVYHNFKDGGKGVATAGGGLFVISPVAGTVTILFFLIFVAITRRVSAASLLSAASMPFIVWYNTESTTTAMGMILVAVLIWLRHKDNIKRILDGTEPRLR